MGSTIVIVEDCDHSREAVALIARRMGHRVICADTCRAARRILEQSYPDLLLLDVALPDGSGIDFVREIREALQQDLPVILFTGSGNLEPLIAGMGVTQCLVKSDVGSSHIRSAIESALNRSPTANRYAVAC